MDFGRDDYNDLIIAAIDGKGEGEPVFLLRGQDPLAPYTVRTWANELAKAGGDPAIVKLAREQAEKMDIYLNEIEGSVKLPDLPA